MDFSTIPNEYLDMTEKKFVKDFYQRRVFVYRNFINIIDDIPIDQNTPGHIHEYLKTLKSNFFTTNTDRNFRHCLTGQKDICRTTIIPDNSFIIPYQSLHQSRNRVPSYCREKDSYGGGYFEDHCHRYTG
jgi:hypothetical protein